LNRITLFPPKETPGVAFLKPKDTLHTSQIKYSRGSQTVVINGQWLLFKLSLWQSITNQSDSTCDGVSIWRKYGLNWLKCIRKVLGSSEDPQAIMFWKLLCRKERYHWCYFPPSLI
jgi:hypothetical protein